MEGQTDQSGSVQLRQQRLIELQPVGVEDRLPSSLRHQPHDVHDLRVGQRITACNRNPVEGALALEHVEIGADLLETLVSVHVGAIAPLTVQVALLGRLEPGDGVVRERPRKPVQTAMIDGRSLH